MFILKYFYIYPVIILLILYIVSYYAYPKKEIKDSEVYKKATFLFITASLIPLFNLFLLGVTIYTIIEHWIKKMNEENFR